MSSAVEQLKLALRLLADAAGAQEEQLREWAINAPFYGEELWLLFDGSFTRVERNVDHELGAAEAATLARPVAEFFRKKKLGVATSNGIYDDPNWSRLRELAGQVVLQFERSGI